MRPFDKSKYFLGKLCRHWHRYEGTLKSLRRHTSRRCVVCVRVYIRKRPAKDNVEYLRKYRVLNKEKIRKWSKAHRENNPEYYKDRNDKYKARPEVKARDKAARLRVRSTPEGLLKLSHISRRSGVRRRWWAKEIVVAKSQPEPKRFQLLEVVEQAIAVKVEYLELKMLLKERRGYKNANYRCAGEADELREKIVG